MKSVSNLVDDLTSGASLQRALYKALVIAERLGDPELTAWVEAEISGYSDAVVPAYRRVPQTPMGTVTNGYWVHNDQRITLSQLPLPQQQMLMTRDVREGVAAVEHLAKQEA